MTTMTHEQKLARNAIADELHRRNPSRAYLDCVEEAVAMFRRGQKPAKKKKKGRRPVDEAVARAVREALTAAQAPRPAPAPARAAAPAAAAAPARPLHQLSAEEADEVLADALLASAAHLEAPFWVGTDG
jgi:hypothetical protein